MRVSPFLTDLEKSNKDYLYSRLSGISSVKLVDWGTKVLIV
jgi:hypothetical protein